MKEIDSGLKGEIERFIFGGGFRELIAYLDGLDTFESDEPIFGHSMTSIYAELSIIKNGMKKKKSISEYIYTLLSERNIKRQSYIYQRGNIERSTWRKLISGVSDEPELKTLYKLAIAFELTIEETNKFLQNFNRAFSANSNMTDQIISYCITKKIYEPTEIDKILCDFEEEALFSVAN